jgi:hypothetical protein
MKIKMKVQMKVPKKLAEKSEKAVMKALEFSALAFERTAKIITTEENHVVT